LLDDFVHWKSIVISERFQSKDGKHSLH
jgi:hypothetical protein